MKKLKKIYKNIVLSEQPKIGTLRVTDSRKLKTFALRVTLTSQVKG